MKHDIMTCFETIQSSVAVGEILGSQVLRQDDSSPAESGWRGHVVCSGRLQPRYEGFLVVGIGSRPHPPCCFFELFQEVPLFFMVVDKVDGGISHS